MWPDLIGAIVGLGFVVAAILSSRRYQADDLVWPLSLAGLPLFYMGFGALALDPRSILLELLAGIPFVLIGLVCWRGDFASLRVLLGLAWIGHGVYDLTHDLFFINPGVFSWYPVFCAIIDVVAGSYLLMGHTRTRERGLYASDGVQ